jgi:TPR repeat protein
MQMFKQTVRAAVSAMAALFLFAGQSGLAYAQAVQTSDEWLTAYQQTLKRNDKPAALAMLEARVQTGDPVALAEQGVALESGSLYPVDLGRAFAVFKRAAEAGNVYSMTWVAWMLKTGAGQSKDEAGALMWYQRAADAGARNAMVEVGFAYETGVAGYKVDYVEAMKWYLKGAEKGEPYSMSNAGNFYQHGRPGIPIDIEKARFWFEKAVAAGHERAKGQLASLPAKAPVFVPRPLPGPKPEQIALFNTALRAAAQMGFKADSIDNDTLEAQLRHNYQGNEVKFSLSVPVVGRLRGSIRVFDDNIREGFIRLYRQELIKALNGAQIEVDGNISGR